MSGMKIPFSIYGVPLLGLGVLLIGLWHPQIAAHSQLGSHEITILAQPNPRQNKIMALFLSQEAKNVARCRQRNQPTALTRTIASYNLIAKECTPAVFQATHLPPAM